MNDAERLTMVEACRALIHRYAYLNDARQFVALSELFTDDGVLLRPSSPEQPIVGRAQILKAMQSRTSSTATFHLCTDVLIEVLSPQHARAQSRILLLTATRPETGHPDPATFKPLLPGMFVDDLVLTNEGWRFARRAGSLWVDALS